MKTIAITIIALTLSLPIWAQNNPTFDAKGIVVLSDADMAASAYIDGHLKLIPEDRDELTLISLDEFPAEYTISKLPVSNSVTNWTKSLDITQDGTIAFVAETKGQIDRKTKKVDNVFTALPAATSIYAIDLSKPDQLRIISSAEVGNVPIVAQLSPDGKHIATVIEEPGKEIVIVSWDGQRFGKPKHFSIGVSFDQKVRATDISWHPSGDYLAVTLEESKQLAFYAVNKKRTGIDLIGSPMAAGELPGAGQFTPDGKFYLLPDLNGWVSDGYLLSIKPDFEKGQHQIVSKAQVGRAPEGFGISADGRQVVIANMQGSHFPYGSELWTNGSSLSLLSMDDQGKLVELDRKPFAGILPENVAFDKDGDMIAVAVYDYNDLGQKKGAVEFWKVSENSLEYSGFKVSVTRGAHVLKVIF
ncbi:MAG: hypothetical protein AAF363_11550 [Bacteroidota bacterium]